MNADLAAVNRLPGKAGYPLRNRSASSNSGEGSQTRPGPDPNRYKKYLSLRNRKILDRQHNHANGGPAGFDEQYSSQTASQRTLDSQTQDQSKPLQPILKSTSSRVSDLRYRAESASLHKADSVESMQEQPCHQQKQQEQLDRQMQFVDQDAERRSREPDHSPLRVKSQQSNENATRSEHKRTPGDQRTPVSQRERSPIQVYRCPQGEEPQVAEQERMQRAADAQKVFNESASKSSRRQTPLDRSDRRSRSGAFGAVGLSTGKLHDPFKSTTDQDRGDEDDEDEEDFHFDFDQDGNCSYVNTTQQSELTTPKESRNSAKRIAQQAHAKSGNIHQLSTLSQKQEVLQQRQQNCSIRAYADELKHCQLTKAEGETDRINESEEDGEDSSGYVIEYEQVLKDNSSRPMQAANIPDYREDVGQDTILEQTQEAIETDSSPDAYRRRRNQNSKRHLRQKSGDSEQLHQQQDSPQFRANITNESQLQKSLKSLKKQSEPRVEPRPEGGFVEEVAQVILQQRSSGQKESLMAARQRSLSDDASSDYRGRQQQQYCITQQEPILTFENRQPASSQRTRTTQQEDNLAANQVLSTSGRSADTGDYRRKTQSHLDDLGSRFKPYAMPSASGPPVQTTDDSRFIEQQMEQQLPNDTSHFRAGGDLGDEQHEQHASQNLTDNIGLNSDIAFDEQRFEATPTGSQMHHQHKYYDLEESNRKLARQNEELEKQFEQQEYGSYVPGTNLVVTCIIRSPMETVGVKQQQINATRSYQSSIALDLASNDQAGRVLSTSRSNKSGTGIIQNSNRAAISSSVGPTVKRHGLNGSHQGLDMSKISSMSGNNRSASRRRGNSQDSRSNHSAGGTRRQKSQPKNSRGKFPQLPNSYRHPHILTTQQPSRFVLRSPPGLQAELLNILLKSELDVKHCQLAFDEHGVQSKMKGRKSMKVFEFDNCIGETKAHSLAVGLEQHVAWITQPRSKVQQSLAPAKDASGSPPKNVIFLFGQSDALKTQLLNVMQPNSLINQCLKARDLRFIRVSTYHMNQEYLLAHKTFGNRQQMRREIGMELREAFRERDLNAKKVALKLSTYSKTVKAEDVKMASHLIIQLDDTVLIDLADIDNLKDTSMAKRISADFSIVTNAILSMSPYYKDHDFGKVDEDRLAPYKETNNFRSGSVSFKNQINRLVQKRSRVLLLCCVIQCSMAGTQAVDYCHKIRSYFHGSAAGQENSFDMTPTRRMQQHQGDMSMETDQNVNAFRQLGGLIQEVSKARLFIDKIFANKMKGEPLKRSRNQLKEMVACLRDDVSDLLNSLAANNENYIHQLKKIRELLQQEIYYMREKVTAMRSIGRRNSIGGSSHKSGRHALCILPKTLLQQQQQPQHSSNKLTADGFKRGSSQGHAAATSTNSGHQTQKRNNSSSNLHNFRPQSQTSFNSGQNNGGSSRPQSGRVAGHQMTTSQSQQKQQRSTMQTRRSSHYGANNANNNSSSSRMQKGNSRHTAGGSKNDSRLQSKNSSSRVPHHQQPMSAYDSQQPAMFDQTSSKLRAQLDSHAKTPISGSDGNDFMRKSHESLPVHNSRDTFMPRGANGSKQHHSSATSLKSLPQNRQSSSKQSGSSRNGTGKVRTGGPYQLPTPSIDMKGTNSTGKKQNPTSKDRFSAQKFASGRHNHGDQLGNLESRENTVNKELYGGESQVMTTNMDDFRRQTLTTLNNQYTMLSGAQSFNASQVMLPEQQAHQVNLATMEALQQEVYALKDQLKQAIDLSEDQAAKRKQAEQNCIELTKELTRAETSLADLEDRIVAKDQTIRSLESQLDFHKNKLQQSRSSRHVSPNAAVTVGGGARDDSLHKESISSQTQQELEVLKIEKAQADRMNQEILGQISMLKDALSTFQEQERTNQKLLRRQAEKDAEMQELKSQVAALMQLKHREPSPSAQSTVKEMRQQMNDIMLAKEKYREEALQLKQEMRQYKYEQSLSSQKPQYHQQHQAIAPERGGSREYQRTGSSKKRVESQDREPLHMQSSKVSDNHHHQQHHGGSQFVPPQQDHVAVPQSTMPQQKSLSTIKDMIRDFKEQRKGLMRTTSSKEAIMQQSNSSLGSRHIARQAKAAQQQQHGQPKKACLRSSRSRENDEREANRYQVPSQNHNYAGKTTQPSGYAHLNSHFR